MANPKPKGKTTIRTNLTIYTKDVDMIKQEKKVSLIKNEIFNTSDFFRFCINNDEIKKAFYVDSINSKTKNEKAVRINLTLYQKEKDVIAEEKKQVVFNTSDFFRFCIHNDEIKNNFYIDMRTKY